MPRPPRCLVADVEQRPQPIDRASVHHLERVLRLAPGDELELVDGRGGLARARWGRRGELSDVVVQPREPAPTDVLLLAVAAPRPSRLDWLVEKSSELGVARLLLLKCRHGVRDVSTARVARLRRKADEALLQCRRLWRMEIDPPATLAAVLAERPAAALWLASPRTGVPSALTLGVPTGPLLALVGPEGGWHPDESVLADDAGARPVGLGPTILRVETAALALAALHALGQGPRS